MKSSTSCLQANGFVHEVTTCSHLIGKSAYFIAPSIDERDSRTNQDSLAIIELFDRSLILAVADGAGAHRGGADASRVALEALSQNLTKEKYAGSWKASLIHAIDMANIAVMNLGIGAASTLVVSHINEKGCRSFHIGDSAALIIGQKGKLKLQTLSHSPVGYAVEAGLIDEEAALQHEDRNIVSNLLGSSEMHIQIGGRVPLSRRDTIILASDGLFDNLRTDEIIEIVRKDKPKKALNLLIKQINKRMLEPKEGQPSKPDDLSVILFRPNERSSKKEKT